MRLDRLVPGAALLLLAAAPLAAQVRPVDPTPVPDVVARRPGGVEVAAASTLLVFLPLIGGHISVPTPGPIRLEAGAQLLPYFLEDGEDVGVVSQVQIRIPLRRGPPGSRRSALLGVTAVTIGDRPGPRRDWEYFHVVLPHVGMSWQWQRSEHIDMRIDVQGVLTFTAPVALPLTTFSIVWHPKRRWS